VPHRKVKASNYSERTSRIENRNTFLLKGRANEEPKGGANASLITVSCHFSGNLDGDGDLSTFTISGEIKQDGSEMVLAIAPNIAETLAEE
jgi:hypothetical protein